MEKGRFWGSARWGPYVGAPGQAYFGCFAGPRALSNATRAERAGNCRIQPPLGPFNGVNKNRT